MIMIEGATSMLVLDLPERGTAERCEHLDRGAGA